MPRRASLRASDEDRENVAEQLRHAAGEGRLRPHELEQRIAAALSASTYGELDALVADLPSAAPATRGIVPRLAAGLALFGVGRVVLIPIALLLAAFVALTAMGILTLWWVWAILAWFWFGGPRRGLGARYLRLGCGGRHGARDMRRPRAYRP